MIYFHNRLSIHYEFEFNFRIVLTVDYLINKVFVLNKLIFSLILDELDQLMIKHFQFFVVYQDIV